LPDINKLREYQYSLTTRLYSEDGVLLKEYANEKRIFVKLDKIPEHVKYAFIAAEDKNFYSHGGIDLTAILSASVYNVKAFISKTQFRGGSTITQQIVKNILLTNERTLERKIKEALLSIKATKVFTKDEILEIYLNYVFLGNNSYGVAAASLNYFNKPLDTLTIGEAAVLASLPKAPGKLNPAHNKEGAIGRRNYVATKMWENGYITKDEYQKSIEEDLVLQSRNREEYFDGGAFTEDTRKKLLDLYDEETILTKGLVVSATIKPAMQEILRKHFRFGLEEYDRRHGYRGDLGNIFTGDEADFEENWPRKLRDFAVNAESQREWKKATLLDFDVEKKRIIIGLLKDSDEISLTDGEELLIADEIAAIKSFIDLPKLKWLADPEKLLFSNSFHDIKSAAEAEALKDFEVETVTDINLKKGSVFFVERVNGAYEVRQFPKVNGGAVALDPHTGRIFAMVGGYMDLETNFNRVTQAGRQIGSTIKPFVYLTAFEGGYDGASKIMDEEIVLPQGEGIAPYKPRNFYNTYYGVVTLRKALQNSYNVSTVRLASQIGLGNIANTISRFHINERPKRVYSMALGSLETKLIDLVNAYGMIVNGGKFIQRETIEKIQDNAGKTLYRRDKRICYKCNIVSEAVAVDDIEVPFLRDERQTVTDKATAYQITSILEGVVKYGTGSRAAGIGKIIGGKTGTNNEYKDAWFIGFSPDLVLGIFVGYDENMSLGRNETGSRVASPIFTSAMKEMLKEQPSIPFRVPENITLKRIDFTTGESPTLISRPQDIIFEAFKKDKIANSANVRENYEDELGGEDGADDDIFEVKNKLEKLRKKEEKSAETENGLADEIPESKTLENEDEENFDDLIF
jgi:penicillin-binding protein 1A